MGEKSPHASSATRVVALSVAAVLALALAGCATERPLPTSASAEELGAEFGACDREQGERSVDPLEALAEPYAWFEISKVVDAQRESDGSRLTFPAVVVDGDGAERTVGMHTSVWPGIDWALDNGGEVWAAWTDSTANAEDQRVSMVLVISPRGEAFFVGHCLYKGITRPVRDRLGDAADEILASLPQTPPDELRSHLQLPEPVEPTEGPVFLNPDDNGAPLLESLDSLGLNLRISDAITDGEYTIATSIPAGWNDGARADAMTAEGVSIGAYYDETRVLTFWLLDRDAIVTEPIGKLGTVTIPSGDPESISVLIDTSSIRNGIVPPDADLVTLEE